MAEAASEDPLALWFASAIGHTERVWQLLEDGEDWMTSHAAMPLYFRVTRRWRGCYKAVARLLDNGTNIKSKSDRGRTPEASVGGYLIRVEAAMLKAKTLRRTKCEAFAMGQLERLGAGSWARGLDAGVVRMVLTHV